MEELDLCAHTNELKEAKEKRPRISGPKLSKPKVLSKYFDPHQNPTTQLTILTSHGKYEESYPYNIA